MYCVVNKVHNTLKFFFWCFISRSFNRQEEETVDSSFLTPQTSHDAPEHEKIETQKKNSRKPFVHTNTSMRFWSQVYVSEKKASKSVNII